MNEYIPTVIEKGDGLVTPEQWIGTGTVISGSNGINVTFGVKGG